MMTWHRPCHGRLRQVLGGALLLSAALPVVADYVVQVGVYTEGVYARQASDRLRRAGFPVEERRFSSTTGREMIRVLVGPFPELKQANAAAQRLQAIGERGMIRKYERTPGAEVILAPPVSSAIPPEGEAAGPVTFPPAAGEEPGAILPPPAPVSPGPTPEGVESLFNIGSTPQRPPHRVEGFFQSELAYTTPNPEHLSKFRQTLELGVSGQWRPGLKWRVTGRFAYDAVFDLNDYYPDSVREDQQLEAMVRETYIDLSAGDWDLRLGRQHIIWGEMVGLFFADVVSAKDLREFILPDFNYLRIPQWAGRAEYFRGDFHGELVWIPYQTYDEIGVPGAEFYPYPAPPPPGYGYTIEPEHRPDPSAQNAGYGVRASYLFSGWDLSAFYYQSVDAEPYFSRRIVTTPAPAYIYTPDHDRIRQFGGTLSKDFMASVLRAEVIYTKDRWFGVDDVTDADGVVRQDTLDYVIGIEYLLPKESRLNLQWFQRWYPDHDPALSQDKLESGITVYASTKFRSGHIEPKVLLIGSLNRRDWLATPGVIWHLGGHWRMTLEADLFGGDVYGLFGRYRDKDRFNAEVRYMF